MDIEKLSPDEVVNLELATGVPIVFKLDGASCRSQDRPRSARPLTLLCAEHRVWQDRREEHSDSQRLTSRQKPVSDSCVKHLSMTVELTNGTSAQVRDALS